MLEKAFFILQSLCCLQQSKVLQLSVPQFPHLHFSLPPDVQVFSPGAQRAGMTSSGLPKG